HNHQTFEWIQYQLDGEVGPFGDQYEIPLLKLMEADPAAFTAIRGLIPYEGLQHSPIDTAIIETDETGKKLASYLSLLELTTAVSSIDELKIQHILETAVLATKSYTTYPQDPSYREELKPFEAPSNDLLGFVEQQFWLKEHVEESIRLLYGNIDYSHQDFGKFRYLDVLGVYTPPHMGGGGWVIPVIFGYEDEGDRVRAEVAYVVEGMGGYLNPGDWEEIPADGLTEYVQTKSTRYAVTVRRESNGRFVLESQLPR
ncbi:hypothetical protein LJC63_07605, partial [Ruminococcaceae bacterium OttesenSCG-928-L11]|nr:hypothetical protein [Ruminococcaceae bacterium OttesenSCG-928-L11]